MAGILDMLDDRQPTVDLRAAVRDAGPMSRDLATLKAEVARANVESEQVHHAVSDIREEVSELALRVSQSGAPDARMAHLEGALVKVATRMNRLRREFDEFVNAIASS